jgi:serine protease inhibitor
MHALLLIPPFFLRLSKEYVENTKKFYLANVEPVDFLEAAEESRKKINSWVEKQTNGRVWEEHC